MCRYTTGGGLLESHTHIEASLVMIAPYCAYATAEALSLSGIVAILFCGIVMAQYTRPNLSVDSQRNTQVIFKVLATLAETFVFIYMVRSDRVYELHVTCQGKIT